MTDNQIALMKHCIGIDNHKPYRRHGRLFYRPTRNYFDSGPADYEAWKGIEANGYAVDWQERINRGETSVGVGWFKLTAEGMAFLGGKLGIHIYNEEAVSVDA